MGKKKGKGGGAAAAAEPEAAEELAIDGEDEVVIGGYTEEAAAGAALEEPLPTFGEPEPAAEPLPTFGESEPLPTFGEPEPMAMNGMGGGLGAEFPVGLSFSTKEDIEKAIAYNKGNAAYDQVISLMGPQWQWNAPLMRR